MGYINPRALFFDLLDDLSSFLPGPILDALRRGEEPGSWVDQRHSELECLQLANSFLKKFKDEISDDADTRALREFLSVNERLNSWSLVLSDSWDEVLFNELRSVIEAFFYPDGQPLFPHDFSFWENIRVGPGSSIESPGTDFYTKLFSSKLSTTSVGLYRSYRSYIRRFPIWDNAEIVRSSQIGEPSVVEGNRLRFVPKKREISRTIAVEPTLNMCAQLSLGSILEGRLKSFFGIDISFQPDINRELARRGSMDDSFATIDLRSASDSLCSNMLKAIFPPHQLSWLEAIRSPTCELPDGRRVKLNMISTMGNGYTFPLQTMLFASFVVASARARGFPLARPCADRDGTFGVFGDDIIIPTNCHYVQKRSLVHFGEFQKGASTVFVNYGRQIWDDVHRFFRLLGFVPNNDKSFLEGPFRESCGFDAFRGQNVRGVYLKSLRTTQDRFVAINTLNRWTARSGIPLPKTIHRLTRSVRLIPVPRWEADDSGIKVPWSLVKKYACCKKTQSVRYRRWQPVTRGFLAEDEDSFKKNRRIFNPDGLLLAFLRGDVRSGKISARSSRVLYRSCFGVAPSWDYPEPVVELSSTGQRWNSAVSSNLGWRRFEV